MILRKINYRNGLLVARCGPKFNNPSLRMISLADRFKTSKEISNKPIEYTKSKAYKYRALENFREDLDAESTVPWYNAWVLKISIAIWLIYFCILREPNDLDDMLDRDLFEIVPDLEIPMLEADIQRLEKQGLNVDDLKRKLEELKRLDQEKKKQQAQKSSS